MHAKSLAIAIVAASLFVAAGVSAECQYAEATLADGEGHPENPCIICDGDEIRDLPVRTRCGPGGSELWCDGTKVWASECVPGLFAGAEHPVCESVNKTDDCPGEQTCNNDVGYCVTLCEGDDDAACSGGRTCENGSCLSPDEQVQPPPPVDMDMGGSTSDDTGGGGPGPDMNDMQERDGGPGSSDDGGTDADLGAGSDLGGGNRGVGGETEGGCCSVSNGPKVPAALLFFLGFIAAFRWRRS